MQQIVLIGGHPNGLEYPFHETTRSGKIIRKLVEKLEITDKVIYFDIWRDQKEEDTGIIQDFAVSMKLHEFICKNYILVALGVKVRKAMRYEEIDTVNLPHPTSRTRTLRLQLEKGLEKLKNNE